MFYPAQVLSIGYLPLVFFASFSPIKKQRISLTVAKKRESDLQKGLILLGDPFISVTESDLTQGEVPPHPNPPPPRGEGRVGEDNQVSFLCNVKVSFTFSWLAVASVVMKIPSHSKPVPSAPFRSIESKGSSRCWEFPLRSLQRSSADRPSY